MIKFRSYCTLLWSGKGLSISESALLQTLRRMIVMTSVLIITSSTHLLHLNVQIFHSLPHEDRKVLSSLLLAPGYVIHGLPLLNETNPEFFSPL